jgi:hypothetical protein
MSIRRCRSRSVIGVVRRDIAPFAACVTKKLRTAQCLTRVCNAAKRTLIGHSDHAAAALSGGIRQTGDRIWLASFMHYDLSYFDDEACRLEPLANPFGPKMLPMSSV